MEWECFWVNLREDNKVSESKMAVSESNMAEFKMATIFKLSQNEQVKFIFVQNSWIQDGRIQDGYHHQVESEWMSEVFFCAKWLNWGWQVSRELQSSSWVRMNEWSCFVQMLGTNLGKCEWLSEEKLRWLNPSWPNSSWQNSRWLPSLSWVRMNEFESDWTSLSQIFVQNGWIQDGKIRDGCHH